MFANYIATIRYVTKTRYVRMYLYYFVFGRNSYGYLHIIIFIIISLSKGKGSTKGSRPVQGASLIGLYKVPP